jgi:hypothetical protein
VDGGGWVFMTMKKDQKEVWKQQSPGSRENDRWGVFMLISVWQQVA